MKLNVLLAKTEQTVSSFKKMLVEYAVFFKSKQKEFIGYKKTYEPKPNTADEPGMRGIEKVVTTVGEKLKWLEETSAEHINNLFSVEATNASGGPKAVLKVGDSEFGELSSLELLRLKSFLESAELESMYANIPVRSDTEIWTRTDDDLYGSDREIYETPEQSGTKKSITKKNFILPDPNVQHLKDTSKYSPQIGSEDTIIELGDWTAQRFSGEWTHRQRAELLRRRSQLLTEVIATLKVANEAEMVASKLTAEKLFGYLHGSH